MLVVPPYFDQKKTLTNLVYSSGPFFSAPALLPTHLGFICTVSFRRTHRTQLVWRETKLDAFANCENIIPVIFTKSKNINS